MVRAQHRLLCFLKLERKPGFQVLAFLNVAFQTDHVFLKLRGLPRGCSHPGIEIANFALQSERAVVCMFSPTDDMAANHFTGSGNELQFGILLSQLPRVLGSADDISVANVIIEMTYTLVETNDTCQRQGTFDRNGRIWSRRAIQDQAVQPSFADRLHNFNRAFRLPAILDDDILKLPPKEVLDECFVFRLDFNEICENAEWRPIQASNGIEKTLNRFRAVRALNGKVTNGL